MNIQVAVLCDAASETSGKLNLTGVFDAIYTQQLPAFHPQCSVALRMTFSPVEEGAHKFRLNIMDEDGKLIMPSIEGALNVSVPEGVHFATQHFIVNLFQLKFEQAGLYSIDVVVDDKQEISIPLLVKCLEPST